MPQFTQLILHSPSQSANEVLSLQNSNTPRPLPSPPLPRHKGLEASGSDLQRVSQIPSPQPDQRMASNSDPNQFLETFYGYVKNRMDALLLIEACIDGALFPLNVTPVDLSRVRIRSGTVLVFAENNNHSMMVRWRDGERWSPSRIHGQFLLYREVISTRNDSGIRNDVPETCTRFTTSGARPNTRLVPNGFAKRTITLTGSDGNRYRVISYFYPNNVAHLYGDETSAAIPPVIRGGSRGNRGVPAGVLLSTPAQNPNLKRFVTRINKEYVDGASGECLADMESFGSPVPAPGVISTGGILPGSGSSLGIYRPGSHPYARQQKQTYRAGVGPSTALHSGMHPYAREQETRQPSPRKHLVRNICGCGGLFGRKWWDFNPDWSNGSPILAPLLLAPARVEQHQHYAYPYQQC
ncbi:Gti1/Pac2 family-domain-containing protein [Chytriomyces sp. MP71]|nr:Gti1/Pac2 family-domain-containing protein [Chytriomyces sp. MP71]